MKSRPRNYLNLFLGLVFIGYGGYRLFSFFNGASYSTFRVIVAIAFVLLGGWDLYRFFKTAEA